MFILLFIVICLAISVGYNTYRHDDPRKIVRETIIFFLYMTGGISAFALVIYFFTVI